MRNILIETIGWVGVLCILAGYTATSFGYIAPASITYTALNIIGGCGLILSAYPKKAFQPIVLNVVWISIALTSFIW